MFFYLYFVVNFVKVILPSRIGSSHRTNRAPHGGVIRCDLYLYSC